MANSLSHVLPFPIKGARFTLLLSFRVAAGTPTDPTTPDTEFSSDGGATFADCAEEITTGGANGMGYLTLTGAETNVNVLAIAAKSANCVTTPVVLYPRVLASVGTGTLSAGSAGGGTLGTLLAYDVTGCFIQTTGGTGGGGTGGASNQARKIVTYTPSTGAFTVTPNWETTPDATTTYSVLLPEGVTLGMLKTLNPTTAGNTLDVTATGEAGIDWGNIGNKTTTNALTATTIATTQKVDIETIKTQTVTCGAPVTVLASVGTAATSTAQTGDSFARLTGTGAVTFASLTVTGVTTCTGNVILSDGLTISAPSTLNRAGITVTGNGTGAGVSVTGGGTGPGLNLIGGGTSGDGLLVTTTSGHGFSIAATGASKHGIIVTGGNSGTSDGLKAVAGTGGVPIRGDITGNITGTLTTVTTATNLTNAPTVGDFTATMKTSIGTAVAASAVASVTGNVGGNVVGTIGGLTAAALKDFFDTDSTTTYASAVAGSVVKEIADNAGGSGLTVQNIVDGVWNEAQTSHTTAGTFGKYLDAAVSGVSTGGVSAADIATAVWVDLLAGTDFSTTSSIGKLIKDNLNATVSSRSTVAATDIVSAGAITTSGGAVATVTDVTNLHASAATVANQTTILNRIGAFTGTGINTILGFFKSLLSKTALAPSDVGGTFDPSTDSTEAIRDRGDVAWITATGFSTLTSADVRTAVGLASANLDTQLAAIVADTNELQTDWTNGGRLDLLIDAILDDTGTSGVVVAAGSKTGYALSATGANAVLVAGQTLPNAIKFIGSICAGVVSNAGTGTENFLDFAGAACVDVTVDASGNRTAITLH